jgi:glutamate racemase
LSIGIFDSGVGGLTVFKAISENFPDTDLYYLGDTARVPYGNKSSDTIIRYSFECANYLISNYNVDAIVIACNSASSYALNALKENFKIPVLGVVHPGAIKALEVTVNNKIAVIGTEATVKSYAYVESINFHSTNKIEVIQKACPLFVPIVEEGMINNSISRDIIKYYLDDVVQSGIDTLVLGCTHYPVLRDVIKSVYPNINIVDSSDIIVSHLIRNNVVHKESGIRQIEITDNSDSFERLKKIIIGDIKVNFVNLEKVCSL